MLTSPAPYRQVRQHETGSRESFVCVCVCVCVCLNTGETTPIRMELLHLFTVLKPAGENPLSYTPLVG